jgi:putative oxidoreductase
MSTFDAAVLLLRLAVGLTFAAHGAQKAFGWWGGPGRERWRGAIAAMGFRPVGFFAYASIVAELVAGLLLAAGLLTPIAAAVLIAQSVVILLHVHWPKGFWNGQGGVEFPLSLLVGAAAIALLGAGSVSLDAVLGFAPDATVRVALVVLGIVAGFASLAVPRVATPRVGAAHHG